MTKLRARRLALRKTAKQLAFEAEISRPYVYMIENGDAMPKRKHWLRLAKAYCWPDKRFIRELKCVRKNFIASTDTESGIK